MDKLWKNLGLPLLIIIIGTLLYRLVSNFNMILFIPASLVLTLIKAFTCFSFGMALKTHKRKRSGEWVGKLIISFVMFFYICLSLGYLDGFGDLIRVLNMLGLTHQTMAVPLIYILCGYLFFD